MKVLRVFLPAVLFPTLALARVQPAPKAQNGAQPTGFRAEYIANLDDVEKKLVSLAEATPADKFTWRPSKDVRSISEVYTHIAGSNYFLASFLGVDAPGIEGDLEKTVTKKAEVIAELKRSFAHLRKASASVRDLEAPVKMFGNQTTCRGVLVTVVSHLHEHLGQSIAYARMNGVIPPWSH